uniref:F-box-like family protein n=1 Tax=Pithovirus LCPAC401 TaxID=2506595 RepID=A0A481Z9Y6_9VIRU|nr:MAG: F-box-like family protein [Pithovirus LCPAC401]
MSQSERGTIRLQERRVRRPKLHVISKPQTSQIQTSSKSSRSPRLERRVGRIKLRVTSKSRISQIQTSSISSRSPKLRREILSVNEILNQLNIRRSDLNSLGSDIIQTIFEDLTVGEISRLCSMSRAFNNVCKKESLWKEKVLRDYKINNKTRRTWRDTARQLYLKSLERYWYDTLEYDLNYYFIEPNQTESPQIDTDYDSKDSTAVDSYYQKNKFRKDFTKRALKDRKAIQATKLLFNAFYLSSRYIQDTEYYFNAIVVDFLPIFRRAAEVSPGGKIPLQWVLDEAPHREVKIREFNPDAWKVAIANKDINDIIPWTQQDYLDYYKGKWSFTETPDYTGVEWRPINHLWNRQDYLRYSRDNKLTKRPSNNSLGIYILPWSEANEELYNDMKPLAELYKQHPELFVDDTKDSDHAEMGMVLMNYPGELL